MALSLRFAAVSDVGRVRKKNDDSGFAGPHFLMVADGMGGAPAGDLASSLAVQTMRRLDAPAPDDLLEALAGAVHRANDRLSEAIEEDSGVEGMGTTIDAVLFDGERIGVAHLGDSRAYLWRDGELLRLTSDHTWVQSLIDEGRITEDEAKVHSHRSLLLKVLDGRHDNDPDLTLYDVQAGDRILLCSDGLSSFVPHDRLERVLSIGTNESVCAELLTLALENMSNDNITVVLADVVDEAAADPGAEPLVVGAASEHPRAWSRLRGWAHREEPEDAMLLPEDIDPEELRYAPREPKRYRWIFRGVVAAVILAIIATVSVSSYNWSQTQYYVSSADGKVAIFQGVQADLPGIKLHHVYELQDVTLSQLPSYRRSQVVDGLSASDLADARAIVDRLRTFARNCEPRATTSNSSATKSPGSTTSTRTPRSTRSSGQSKPGPTSKGGSSGTKGTKNTKNTSGTRGTGGTGGSSSGGSPEECAGATPTTGTAS